MTAKSDKKNKWLPKQIKRIAAKLYKNGRQTEKQKQNGCQISKWPPSDIKKLDAKSDIKISYRHIK